VVTVLDFLRHELRPYPGRTASAARIVLACVITMLIVVVAKIPFGFLAVLFVIAIPRGNSEATTWNGIRIVLATVAGAAFALAALRLFADYPLPYFLSVAGRLFLVFFLTRTFVNSTTAFGFSIIVIAAIVVWDRPGFTVEGQVETTIWTAIGMILATFVTMAIEWLLAPRTDSRSGHAGAGNGGSAGPLFVDDAFSNPEHVAFALKGCLAATMCYLFYSAVAWRGMAVCTVTCVLAAPVAPVGSARQRLLTRLAGLLIGGVVLGIGSQVFVLPFADSIVGFAMPFAAACAVIAWCATASPRLSYISRPMAMGYLLTQFQTYGPNPSLALTRDRLMGVLLGIVLMWLVFDSGAHFSLGQPATLRERTGV
jgi:uncharacterized membrane protein YccC